MPTKSVFASYERAVFPYRFEGTIVADQLVGGIPSDPKVAESWLRQKFETQPDEWLADAVAEVMTTRQVSKDDAIKEVILKRHLNGFKRTADGTLYYEGRQLKAAIKESASILWADRRWGPTRKGTRSYFSEHVFVEEDVLSLGVKQPTKVSQRFISTFRGQSISYDEVVVDATFDFTVVTNADLTSDEWGHLWANCQLQGIGAVRSQGFGRFAVVRWDQVDALPKRSRAKK